MINPKLEACSGLEHDHNKMHSADILIDNWRLGGKAGDWVERLGTGWKGWGLGGKAGDWVERLQLFTSPLKSEIILEASVTAATVATENKELCTYM